MNEKRLIFTFFSNIEAMSGAATCFEASEAIAQI
jgi:hypothetical protein